jgi:GNAT superfamily N-acetyltransferase
VVEGDRLPKGYVLAAVDTAAFNRWMETQWLPILRYRYPRPFPSAQSEEEQNLITRIHHPLVPSGLGPMDTGLNPPIPPWLASYPAHLHIDLLPELQGQGWGRALMETLLEELWSRGCPGVHLGVSACNTGAFAFYTRLDFSIVQREPWGFTMGKKNGG